MRYYALRFWLWYSLLNKLGRQERIVAAAIRHGGTGEVYAVPPPGRHHTVIGFMKAKGQPFADKHEEKHQFGFTTSSGYFVRRVEGWAIAHVAGQIIASCGGDTYYLYSENVW